MELMTSRWTDDRMDDLKHQVDELGRRMEDGFTEQRREMNIRFDRLEESLEERFDKVDKRFEKVDERFERVDERFEKAEAKFEAKFEKVDDKFEALLGQVIHTQEMVIGVHATLTRFSLGLAGAAIVAILAALVAS